MTAAADCQSTYAPPEKYPGELITIRAGRAGLTFHRIHSAVA